MSAFYVVVDDLEDWKPYFPSQDVISFEQYLAPSPKLAVLVPESLTVVATQRPLAGATIPRYLPRRAAIM